MSREGGSETDVGHLRDGKVRVQWWEGSSNGGMTGDRLPPLIPLTICCYPSSSPPPSIVIKPLNDFPGLLRQRQESYFDLKTHLSPLMPQLSPGCPWPLLPSHTGPLSIIPMPRITSDIQKYYLTWKLHFLLGWVNSYSTFTFQLLSLPQENPPWTSGSGLISPFS